MSGRPGWPTIAALTALALGTGTLWAIQDYRRWRALGVGGLPPTVGGWLQVTRMRLKAGDPLAIDATGPVHPLVQNLAHRGDPRPTIAPHPVPHRVLDQHASADLIGELAGVFDEFSTLPGMEYRTSGWEKHNQALFVSSHDFAHEVARSANGEFGHVHPSDGSMHVILSKGDAATVISKGWGELHPLAGRMLRLPQTYTLLYPPRSRSDLVVARSILTAAASYMSGQRVTVSP